MKPEHRLRMREVRRKATRAARTEPRRFPIIGPRMECGCFRLCDHEGQKDGHREVWGDELYQKFAGFCEENPLLAFCCALLGPHMDDPNIKTIAEQAAVRGFLRGPIEPYVLCGWCHGSGMHSDGSLCNQCAGEGVRR